MQAEHRQNVKESEKMLKHQNIIQFLPQGYRLTYSKNFINIQTTDFSVIPRA